MKSWLKGGLIGAIIGVAYCLLFILIRYIVPMISSPNTFVSVFFFALLLPLMPIGLFLCGMGEGFILSNKICNNYTLYSIIGLLIFVLIAIAVGAIIGLIVGKIRSKKS